MSFVEDNERELARLRELVAGLTDADLEVAVNPGWTVADALGHLAFWDARALALAEKLARGEAWVDADYELDDVETTNAAVMLLERELEPRQRAELSLKLAETVDARLAGLPAERMWPQAERSPLNSLRAAHRGEHLDEIEAALHAT